MENRTALSPLLPWEVIERIIGHSWHPKTIRNFSLTCRELRPRSLCLLVTDVMLHSRDQTFDFCDFLRAKPHLKPLVCSITLDPDDFVPVPLLRILPNISRVQFTRIDTQVNPRTGVHTLCFSNLHFTTSIKFLKVLLAFTRVTCLTCSDVFFMADGDQAALALAVNKQSQRLRLLSSVHLSYSQKIATARYYDTASVGRLLLDSGLVQYTVDNLTLDTLYRSSSIPQQFNWPQLRSLTLKLWPNWTKQITPGALFLRDFHHLSLKDVTVEVHEDAASLSEVESIARHADFYEELERALTRFSKPRLVWVMTGPFMGRSLSPFRIEEFGKFFPALFERGAFEVVANMGLHARHDDAVVSLAVLSDSKLAASGSWDGTIILWDTIGHKVVNRWCPTNRWEPTPSFAFSPNGRCLISSAHGKDRRPVIWDLGKGPHQPFEGLFSDTVMLSCLWSPKGDVIAFVSQNATIHLWAANDTFRPLRVLRVGHGAEIAIELVEFSPNGRWLLTGCRPSSYSIWDVASGTGRQLRTSVVEDSRDVPIAAAFNPISTRFAIASPRGMVEILETDGGEWGYVVLGCGVGKLGWETSHIAFSPDGKRLLTVQSPGLSHPPHAVKVWDAHTGAELLSLDRHKGVVCTTCFSPCGAYIASASWDHTVRLWRVCDGLCITTLYEHNSEVLHVVFSPDGKTLISGARDGTVIIREMRDVLSVTCS